MGVTIRVTIYELKSKSALRYHFCFSLPTSSDASEMAQQRRQPPMMKSVGQQQSLVCFEADNNETNNKDEAAAADGGMATATPGRLDQKIGTSTFCRAFPWHFMLDRTMQLVQLGVGFMRLFGSDLKKHGRHMDTYFHLKKPQVEAHFDKILKKANSPFVLAVHHVSSSGGKESSSNKAKLQVKSLPVRSAAGGMDQ